MNKPKWTSETAAAVRESTGARDPVEGAIILAERFVEQNELTQTAGATARSLDLFASMLDARIECVAMAEAGQLLPTFGGKSDYLIRVNESDSPPRQAFSACHEMGHLLMPNYSEFPGPRHDMNFMRWNPECEEEMLCDVVAAQLLMPRRLWRARLRGEGVGIAAVEPLCKEFGTSQQATIFNIVRAGIEDVAVVYWEWGCRKEETKRAQKQQTLSMFADSDDPMFAPAAPPEKLLRVQRVHSHGTMADYFFPPNRSVDNDSLMARSAAQLMQCGDSVGSHASGPQIIRCKRDNEEVAPEFYTESRAYFTKNFEQTRVISFVFPKEPRRQNGQIEF